MGLKTIGVPRLTLTLDDRSPLSCVWRVWTHGVWVVATYAEHKCLTPLWDWSLAKTAISNAHDRWGGRKDEGGQACIMTFSSAVAR